MDIDPDLVWSIIQEVGAVLLLVLILLWTIRWEPLVGWQWEVFGQPLLTNAAHFMALPLLVLAVGQREVAPTGSASVTSGRDSTSA